MSLSVMLWHMWSIVTKLWHFQARKVYRFTFCRCNQQLNVVSSWSKICFSPIVLVIYDPNYNLSKNVKFCGDRDSELSPIFIHQKGRKKRSSSELFKRHIKIVQHVVWHIYRYYITIIFVQVNFTNESFLKESAQIHNIIFRFLWLLINAFTNTCSILNITFSCHSSLRKSNRFLTVFLWAYFEHTMAFFDTFSLFSLSSQQTRELRSFFTYITLSFTPEQIACTPAVFTFNFCIFSFFFCLFVCQAGVTKARSMSLSKANKQRNEQNGQDMYFFLLCFLNLPRSPKETENAPMHYSINNKKPFGQNLRRSCWLCWRQFRIDGSPQRIQNVCYYLLRINNRCNRLQWLLCGKGYS